MIKMSLRTTSMGPYFTKKKCHPELPKNKFEKRMILYTGRHELGNGIYIIVIFISQTDSLVISAQLREEN
jgi:hypothetical protein